MKYYIITNDEECDICGWIISLCKKIGLTDIHREHNELNTCINCGTTITTAFLEDQTIVKISKRQYELFYALFSNKC